MKYGDVVIVSTLVRAWLHLNPSRRALEGLVQPQSYTHDEVDCRRRRKERFCDVQGTIVSSSLVLQPQPFPLASTQPIKTRLRQPSESSAVIICNAVIPQLQSSAKRLQYLEYKRGTDNCPVCIYSIAVPGHAPPRTSSLKTTGQSTANAHTI
jgi:hypothetical protein